jgi:hypothetical protein
VVVENLRILGDRPDAVFVLERAGGADDLVGIRLLKHVLVALTGTALQELRLVERAAVDGFFQDLSVPVRLFARASAGDVALSERDNPYLLLLVVLID